VTLWADQIQGESITTGWANTPTEQESVTIRTYARHQKTLAQLMQDAIDFNH
jgi:hypothetical protein